MLHRPGSAASEYHEYRKVGAVQLSTFIRPGILNITHTGYGSAAPQRFMDARLHPAGLRPYANSGQPTRSEGSVNHSEKTST